MKFAYFPPSSQTKLRQVPKQNSAIFPNRTPPSDRTKYSQLGDYNYKNTAKIKNIADFWLLYSAKFLAYARLFPKQKCANFPNDFLVNESMSKRDRYKKPRSISEVLFPKYRRNILPFIPYPLVEVLVGCRGFEATEGLNVRAEFDIVEGKTGCA